VRKIGSFWINISNFSYLNMHVPDSSRRLLALVQLNPIHPGELLVRVSGHTSVCSYLLCQCARMYWK
jgi:hypothetical protein